MGAMTSTKETPQLLQSDMRGRVRAPRPWQESLLDGFEQSGLSGAKFAALVGIKYPTFASWVLRRCAGWRRWWTKPSPRPGRPCFISGRRAAGRSAFCHHVAGPGLGGRSVVAGVGEGPPMHLCFAQGDADAQERTAFVGADAQGDETRAVEQLAVVAHVFVAGVPAILIMQDEVGERVVGAG